MSEREAFPPDPREIASAFEQAAERAGEFEDIRWLAWLYDSLEEQDWQDARWQGYVLSEKGYGELVSAVDRQYGQWLDDG